MFTPTRAEVRRFFRAAWRKQSEGVPLEPIEAIAADIVSVHPEVHGLLAADSNAEAGSVDTSADADDGGAFLHLSLHLAVREQISIDQPPGIRAQYERLAARSGAHPAFHAIMECLGRTLHEAQTAGTGPDGQAYLERISRL